MQAFVNASIIMAMVVAGMVWVGIMFALGRWVGGRAYDWWHRKDRQLQALEDQLWRERLPDWEREAVERADRQRAEIRREAHRRLGMAERGSGGRRVRRGRD
jgi:hypothetical protein